MLAKRIATALVLLAILLPAIFVFPPIAWGLVSLAFVAVGAWEWAVLLGRRDVAGLSAGVVAIAGGLYLWLHAQVPMTRLTSLWWSGALLTFWCVGGAWRLARGDARSGGGPLAMLLLIGCWAAMLELRLIGVVALLTAMAIVWVADIAAYFVGRAVGRRKLAPRISPGKSWEGAIGGFVSVALIGALAASSPALAQGIPAVLHARLGFAGASLVLVGLAALSIVGDLHESLLKRQAGAKDSGWILPGHGGVLDRVDALIPVMPAVLFLHGLLDGMPGGGS